MWTCKVNLKVIIVGPFSRGGGNRRAADGEPSFGVGMEFEFFQFGENLTELGVCPGRVINLGTRWFEFVWVSAT